MRDAYSERWYIDRQPVHPAYNRGGWYVRTADGYRIVYVHSRAVIRQIVRDHNRVMKMEGNTHAKA